MIQSMKLLVGLMKALTVVACLAFFFILTLEVFVKFQKRLTTTTVQIYDAKEERYQYQTYCQCSIKCRCCLLVLDKSQLNFSLLKQTFLSFKMRYFHRYCNLTFSLHLKELNYYLKFLLIFQLLPISGRNWERSKTVTVFLS